MTDLVVADLPGFIAAARERGIGRAVVAWQDEWTQVPERTPVDYARVRRTVVLGYAQGGIVSLTLDGDAAERAVVAEALRGAALTVELRCRNLGASERAR